MKWRRGGAVLLISLLVSSCSQLAREEADGKPLRTIEAAQVVEPTPRPDPILAAGNTSPYRVYDTDYTVLTSALGYRERGTASWYGLKFHGRATANGEIYDAYAATAAHRTLPIPCYVRVTNLENGRSMVLRVNDRGPFHPERIIDLSYGAAVKLGFVDRGTAPVEVVALEVDGVMDLRQGVDRGATDNPYRYLQVGSFGDVDSAHRLRSQLVEQLQIPVVVAQLHTGDKTWHRVRVGPIDDLQRLLSLQIRLQRLGYEQTRMMPDS